MNCKSYWVSWLVTLSHTFSFKVFISICVSDGALLYANPGHNVTLPCFFGSTNVKYLSWYKQAAGETPQIISTFYKHSRKSNIFENPFKDDKRFSFHPGDYHLNISNVRDSDSAMYYCGHTEITSTKFYNGTFLVLKGISDNFYIFFYITFDFPYHDPF